MNTDEATGIGERPDVLPTEIGPALKCTSCMKCGSMQSGELAEVHIDRGMDAIPGRVRLPVAACDVRESVYNVEGVEGYTLFGKPLTSPVPISKEIRAWLGYVGLCRSLTVCRPRCRVLCENMRSSKLRPLLV